MTYSAGDVVVVMIVVCAIYSLLEHTYVLLAQRWSRYSIIQYDGLNFGMYA
jgi:hypothetical protein